MVGHSNGPSLLPLFYFSEEGKAIDVAADALDKCVAKRPPVVMLLLLNIFRLRFSIFYIFPLFFLPPPPSFLFLHSGGVIPAEREMRSFRYGGGVVMESGRALEVVETLGKFSGCDARTNNHHQKCFTLLLLLLPTSYSISI